MILHLELSYIYLLSIQEVRGYLLRNSQECHLGLEEALSHTLTLSPYQHLKQTLHWIHKWVKDLAAKLDGVSSGPGMEKTNSFIVLTPA